MIIGNFMEIKIMLSVVLKGRKVVFRNTRGGLLEATHAPSPKGVAVPENVPPVGLPLMSPPSTWVNLRERT